MRFIIQNTHSELQSWTKHLQTFHFLTQFVLTRSETELDHYQRKMNVRGASLVAERLKT